MKLTAQEKQWVGIKLSSYDIKYQEIYDELNDHLLTAIEQLRSTGDNRDIETLFKQVVSEQFPGYWPFEDIVKQYREAYGKKIRQALWSNVKYYFNWQWLLFTGFMILWACYLPSTKAVTLTFTLVLLAAAILPVLYFYIQTRNVKTEKGKQSLVKSYVMGYCYSLVWMFNFIFDGLAPLSKEWRPMRLFNPAHFPAVLFMVMLSIIIAYGLSCMRLVKQQFKIAD